MTTLAIANHPPIPADAMCWRRSFSGRAEVASLARQFVEFLLAGCSNTDEALFAAHEMFCNAIEHSDSRMPGGLVVIEVRRWCGRAIAISVTDQGGLMEPQVRPFAEGELPERGYGLRTIAATASSWGWYGSSASRTVTAVFAS